jgi:hypothetical protein
MSSPWPKDVWRASERMRRGRLRHPMSVFVWKELNLKHETEQPELHDSRNVFALN